MEGGVRQINEHVFMVAVPQAYGYPITASYLVKGEKIALIEAGFGASAEDLARAIGETGLGLEAIDYIFVTHSHPSHASAVGALLKSCPKAKVAMHPGTSKILTARTKMLRDAREVLGDAVRLFEPMEPVPKDRIVAVGGGEIFDFGNGVRIRVVRTPGHAPDHVAFYEELTGTLFPGDGVCMYSSEIPVFVPICWGGGAYDIETVKESLNNLDRLNSSRICSPHTGIVPLDSKEFIERCKAAIDEWHDWIKEMLKKGKTYFGIIKACEEEIAKGAGYRSAAELPEYFRKYWLPILPKFMVQGFMAHILWKF